MYTKDLNHFLMAYLFRNSLKMEMAFVVTLHEDNTLRRQANKTQQSVSTEDSAVMQGSHNTLSVEILSAVAHCTENFCLHRLL